MLLETFVTVRLFCLEDKHGCAGWCNSGELNYEPPSSQQRNISIGHIVKEKNIKRVQW